MGGVLEQKNGRPVDLATPRRIVEAPPEPGEQGSATGGGRLFEWIDGRKLFGLPKVTEDAIDEMLRLDGKAKTLEQVLTLPLRGASWSLTPGAGDRGEAEFVREALTRPANGGGMTTPFDLVIAQMTSAVLYRRCFFEKVWKRDGDRLTYDKLALRPVRTCWLLRDHKTGAFQGFKQRYRGMRGDTVEVEIGPAKAFVYIHGQHRDPLGGVSDMETAYAAFESKQKVRFLWFTFLENLTLPKAVAKHENSDPAEIQAFAKKVATLKGGGVVGIGPDQSVIPFESSNSAAQVFRDAMDYLSSEMSGSVLASFTDLASQGGKGSYALSKDQSDFFLRSRQAVLGEMGTAIGAWVVADLVRWNFGTAAAVPMFAFGELAEGAVSEALTLMQELTGGPPDPRIPAEFLDMLVEKVAGHLGLDVDRVHRAIAERQEGARSPTAQLAAGIDAAARLVAEAGVAEAA